MKSLMRYINRTSRLSNLYREKKFKEYGLKGMHHYYIMNICRTPGVSQEQLANKILVNKSNVARQVAALEKKGFIYREPSPTDGRELLVYPTEKAYEMLSIISDTLREWNDGVLQDFSPEEREILVKAMEKILGRAIDIVDNMPND